MKCCANGELSRERKGDLRFADCIPLLYLILKPFDLLIIYSNEMMREVFNLSKSRKSVQMLVIIAMMIALEVVLSRFLSISIGDSLKFAFNFVPVCVIAYLYGPIASMLVAGLGDLLGSLLFPVGPPFYGFTLTAALTGLCFGFFLHKKYNFLRILFGVVIVQIALTLFLDALWFNLFYGTPYLVALATRAIKAGVMIVVQCVTLGIVMPAMDRIRRQLKL